MRTRHSRTAALAGPPRLLRRAGLSALICLLAAQTALAFPASLFTPDQGRQPDAPAFLPLPPMERPAGPGAADSDAPAGKNEGQGARSVHGGQGARGSIVEARLEPSRPLILSAPFSGLLVMVAVRDGERVAPGDLVARFDAESPANEPAGARRDRQTPQGRAPEPDRAEQEGPGQSETEQGGPKQSRTEQGGGGGLSDAPDAMPDAMPDTGPGAAPGAVLALEKRLAQASLAAPFAGLVTEVRAHAGQHLKQGDPVAELVEDGDLEIVCTVPSAWTARLRPGHVIWVWVDESAQSYEAVFERFGGKVDPASKTIRAYARFALPAPELLPGMSGRANFFPPQRAGN